MSTAATATEIRRRGYSGSAMVVSSKLAPIAEADSGNFASAPASPVLHHRSANRHRRSKLESLSADSVRPLSPRPTFVTNAPLENQLTAAGLDLGAVASASSSEDEALPEVRNGSDTEEAECEFESITTSSDENSVSQTPTVPLARTNTVVRLRSIVASGEYQGEKLRRCASQPISVGRGVIANADMVPTDTNTTTPRRATTFAEDDSSSTAAALEQQALSSPRPTNAGGSNSPRVGFSAVFSGKNETSAPSVQMRSYVPLDSGWSRLRRSTGSVFKRTGLSVRSTEPLHTLVYYSADPLGQAGRTIFRIPNSQIDPYMRTALMRAHKSTVAAAGPYRLCECGNAKCTTHPLPDLKAKFVAVFVLDADVSMNRPEHRALLREHLKRESALQKGEWDVYRLPNNEITDFVSTPAIHVFIIDCFV